MRSRSSATHKRPVHGWPNGATETHSSGLSHNMECYGLFSSLVHGFFLRSIVSLSAICFACSCGWLVSFGRLPFTPSTRTSTDNCISYFMQTKLHFNRLVCFPWDRLNGNGRWSKSAHPTAFDNNNHPQIDRIFFCAPFEWGPGECFVYGLGQDCAFHPFYAHRHWCRSNDRKKNA